MRITKAHLLDLCRCMTERSVARQCFLASSSFFSHRVRSAEPGEAKYSFRSKFWSVNRAPSSGVASSACPGTIVKSLKKIGCKNKIKISIHSKLE